MEIRIIDTKLKIIIIYINIIIATFEVVVCQGQLGRDVGTASKTKVSQVGIVGKCISS